VHGPFSGELAAVDALLASGVHRVVVGLLHPLAPLRGQAVAALRAAGLEVLLPGDSASICPHAAAIETASLRVNEPLLHRCGRGAPFTLWKYAMTLDGKIATSTGDAAWVSSPPSRQRVYSVRSRSDAIVIGGNTLRRDNPRLTTRQESGHMPLRVVLTRSLDVPAAAHLWDLEMGPTLVVTEVGSRPHVQAALRLRGVEVVALPTLTPAAVASLLQARGCLQCLWECGGALAAPALAQGVVHQVQAFVAPKLIGGAAAPTPLGDLGLSLMADALPLEHATFQLIGSDLLATGYLAASGGLHAAAAAAAAAALAMPPAWPPVVRFYKSWDAFGALSNFSPHPIRVAHGGESRDWGTVEVLSCFASVEGLSDATQSFYQAHKFAGVDSSLSRAIFDAILRAPTPEAAARLGRLSQRATPAAVRPDWQQAKVDVMRAALRAKFTQHAAARALLLATGSAPLVEASPNDYVWGEGLDGTGENLLGKLLMELREELRAFSQQF